MSRSRGPHPLRALAVQVLAVLVVSLGGLAVARHLLPDDLLRANSDPLGDYLQVLGTIYSVLQAFVVFVVWTQFNECRALIEREANEVADLFRTTQGLPAHVATALRQRLISYADCVLDVEWPAMAARDVAALEHASDQLEDTFAEIRAFEPGSDRECVLFGEALGRFNELSDVRVARLTNSCVRVPLPLRLLLHTGAILIVVSTYMLRVESVYVHMFITGAIAGAITHIHYIVDDLDDPFSGSWQVSRVHFERVRKLLGRSEDAPRKRAAA